MATFELLIENCTAGANENIEFETIEELKQKLLGKEFLINGGLIHKDRIIPMCYYSGFENIEALTDFLRKDPDITSETLTVINQLKFDFSNDLKKAIEFYEENFYMNCRDMENFGREHAESTSFDIPEHIEPFFDYERYGISEALNFKRIENTLFNWGSLKSF